VAASLGLERSQNEELVALHLGFLLGVRVDQAGVQGLDFHTAQGVPSTERQAKSVVSRRSYLQDAAFTALLVETDAPSARLEEVINALRHPCFTPYLGRRSCPPSVPVLASRDAIVGQDWEALFDQVPPAANPSAGTLYVEGPVAVGAGLRTLRMRDEHRRLGARLFHERDVTQLLPIRANNSKDTVAPWFPK